MSIIRQFGIAALILLLSLAATPFCRADDVDADLTSKGLIKSGSLYVLPGESDVVSAMRTLRQSKAKLDSEMRVRIDLDRRIQLAKDFIKQCENRHLQLEERLTTVTDYTVHNQIVGQMNLLFVKAREAHTEQMTMEEQASKVGVTAKAEFVDAMMAAAAKAESLTAKYTALATDPDIKTAVAKINETAKPHIRVAPTSAFTVANNQLKLWRKDIETESIPLYEESGVHLVDVLLNGVSHRMVLDSGASLVTLPSELAEELKMVPGPRDREVQMQIADGSTILGHQMTLKSVRVGRFTMENVECVVLERTPNKAPALLGNTFLSHFIMKLDAQQNALHLTALSKEDKMIKTTGADGGKGGSRTSRDMSESR